MKLFIGIEIPALIKKHIADFVQPLQLISKGWENPNDYHLTLLFLGESSNEVMDEIIMRLANINFKPFEIELSNFEFFPRRVLFLALGVSLELIELEKQIAAIFPEWIKPEAKAFVPHITVKRWQRYEFNFLETGILSRPFVPLKLKVKGLALFKSEKDFQNNKYHIIHRIDFK